MIVVVEGIDRVGKTTLCKRLEDKGFWYFKDIWNMVPLDSEVSCYVTGKFDSTLNMLKMLNEKNVNVVIDRLHLTEFVYGCCERGGSNFNIYRKVDEFLAALDCMLVLMSPTDVKESSRQHGSSLTMHNRLFNLCFEESKIKLKYRTMFDGINYLVSNITGCWYDLYFASPFFNPEQIEREESLIASLRTSGFRVFSPKESILLKPNSSDHDQEKAFNENVKAIKKASAVFAVTDGKDVGTIWEAGYAYGVGKPIIYFAETLGNNNFNVMLAKSGNDVFLSRSQITKHAIERAIAGGKMNYKGCIE